MMNENSGINNSVLGFVKDVGILSKRFSTLSNITDRHFNPFSFSSNKPILNFLYEFSQFRNMKPESNVYR